jgi:glycosyltransferase involved in cell wall biosynthesis
MNTVQVSILLPIYNPKIDHLVEAVRSIILQTFDDFECIFICDDLTDDVTKILNTYQLDDERFSIIYGDNQGLVSALNKGIDQARGKYIARMDADDISLPNRLKSQVDFMNSTCCDIVGGHYFIINDAGEYVSARVVPTSHKEISLVLSKTVPFAHSSVMMRRDFILRKNLRYAVDENNISEDYQLWTQMFTSGAKFGNVSHWILKYRLSETSLNKRVLKKSLDHAQKIRTKYIKINKLLLSDLISDLNISKFSSETKEIIVYLSLRLAFECGIFSPLFKLRNFSKRTVTIGLLSFILSKC